MNKKRLITTLFILTVLICIAPLKSVHADNKSYKQANPYSEEFKEYKYMDEKYLDSSTDNAIYRDIYKAIINLDDSVDLSKYGTPTSTKAFDIRKKVLDDHPEIFYFKYEGSVYWSNGKLELKYIAPKETVKSMINELNNKVNYIIRNYTSDSMSDMEKVIAIHDYIVLNTEYVVANDYAFDTYGILVKGRGVCQGYSMSMKLLLNKIGVECSYVVSPQMNHMWNIVNIDGVNYQMDATWDDPVPDRKGVVRYTYLALSNAEMAKDHTWDQSNYVRCNSDKYKYMREMDYVVNGNTYRYYTNTNDGYYIYKIKKDGSSKQKISSTPGEPLYIRDMYLYYKDMYTGNTKSMLINDSSNVADLNKFIDIQNHWAKRQIDEFEEKGYINGYGDNTFRPDNQITRAEFVRVLNSYFGLTKRSGKVFSDTRNHWAKDQIDIAVTNGVANGVSSTEFKPDEPITREQAAKMIANYKKISDKNYDKLSKYVDSNLVSSWAKDSVEGILEYGYMVGYSDKTFKPKNNITRAEAVVTLSRVK